jgi:pilus assembly protein CpaC
MHRTNPGHGTAFWGVLLGLLLSGLCSARAGAQEPMPAPKPSGSVIVAINGTQRLQMSTKKPISQVNNEKENVVRVSPVIGDPSSVLLTGLEPGISRVTFRDVDGKVEAVDVVVQFDIEYLRSLIRRAVPTAFVEPIPGANSTVVLTGFVTHTEDIDTVVRLTQSVVLGPDRVINAMRVGGVQQVQLCVVVATVVRDEFRRMAFDFLESDEFHFLGSTGSGAVATPSIVGVGSSQLSVAGALSGIPGSPGGAPTNLFFGVLHSQSGFLAFLQALRDESIAKVLAEPRLTALSGRQASFLSGGEQAVPVPAGLGQVGVQFEEFGTRLNFVPVVLGNGKIHLEVEPEVSDLSAANGTNIQGTVVPGRVTQRVHTTVELNDGETFLIGGLIQHESAANARKVPILGDLPYVGTAFRSVAYDERETELVVMVTPHLVDAMACDQLPKYVPGLETRSPDDCELFLEGILEAPRGPRAACQNGHYVPAYQNGPTAGIYPCAGGKCGSGNCGNGRCTGGCCGTAGVDGMPMAEGHGPVGVGGSMATQMPAALDTTATAAKPATLPAASQAVGAQH